MYRIFITNTSIDEVPIINAYEKKCENVLLKIYILQPPLYIILLILNIIMVYNVFYQLFEYFKRI